MKKLWKRFIWWLISLIDKHQSKTEDRFDDIKFTIDLCVENDTLDWDKYNRLKKMLKRKYK